MKQVDIFGDVDFYFLQGIERTETQAGDEIELRRVRRNWKGDLGIKILMQFRTTMGEEGIISKKAALRMKRITDSCRPGDERELGIFRQIGGDRKIIAFERKIYKESRNGGM